MALYQPPACDIIALLRSVYCLKIIFLSRVMRPMGLLFERCSFVTVTVSTKNPLIKSALFSMYAHMVAFIRLTI